MHDARVLERVLNTVTEYEGMTVRQFLVLTLRDLWNQGDGFSGKYGLTGDSDWQYIVYTPLIRDGLIEGKLDSDGMYAGGLNHMKADELICAAIEKLSEPTWKNDTWAAGDHFYVPAGLSYRCGVPTGESTVCGREHKDEIHFKN